MTPATPEPKTAAARPVLAAWTVRLAGAWLAAGALFKLFAGTPALLPEVIQDLPLSLGLTYRLAIAIELAVACLAFLRPGWGWLLVAGALLSFDAVLVTQIAAGTKSCGCFGDTITIPPALMLAIDSVLLVAVLATKPWAIGPRGAHVGLVALGCAVGIALPWVYDREVKDGGSAAGSGAEATERRPGGPKPRGREWVELDIEDWVGDDLGQTVLTRWIDPYALPSDGLWVFYRQTCDHCAHHLEVLATEEIGERMLALIRLAEPHDNEANRLVHVVPEGDFVAHAVLPDVVDYILETPGEMVVEAWKVVSAEEGASAPGGEE